MKRLLRYSFLTFVLFWANVSSAVPLQLALVLDGSGSINSTDWQLQLDGYANAFGSGSFYDDYIVPSQYDSLWVTAIQFSTSVQQEIAWTQISSNQDADDFGALFTFAQLTGWTNTDGALQMAVDELLNNNVDGDMIIDISTDGNPTTCKGGTGGGSFASSGCPVGPPNSYESARIEAVNAANAARDENITVNAIGVGNGINENFLNELVGINPLDTPTGFYLLADNFGSFGSTLEEKLGKEIGVPEPTAFLLLTSCLISFGFMARKKHRA